MNDYNSLDIRTIAWIAVIAIARNHFGWRSYQFAAPSHWQNRSRKESQNNSDLKSHQLENKIDLKNQSRLFYFSSFVVFVFLNIFYLFIYFVDTFVSSWITSVLFCNMYGTILKQYFGLDYCICICISFYVFVSVLFVIFGFFVGQSSFLVNKLEEKSSIRLLNRVLSFSIHASFSRFFPKVSVWKIVCAN